ncbi:MAG: copper amine oxidase N-terminal domain-containing protein, partial [Gorillibacterium sp.]|nr:copper amine oxidase N-terminal domain-containing protein [Gorillibacterium sp.]
MKQKTTQQGKPMKWVAVPLAMTLLLGASATLLPQTSGTAYAEDYSTQVKLKLDQVNIQVNGQITQLPGGFTEAGDTYVRLTSLSKLLGFNTSWDAKTRFITVYSTNKTLKLLDQNANYELNGHRFYGVDAPVVIKGATYMPLRFLLQQMG